MPYWRLSLFYFFYFATLGALAPLWPLYLKSLEFNAVQIGQLMAILMATKIIAPYLWGWLGDYLDKRMAIVCSGAFLSALSYLLVFWVTDYWGLVLAMALFSFFWNAILPLVEVTTFRHLGEQSTSYSRIRVWGSIGFIVTILALGYFTESYGIGLLLPVLAVLYLGIWISSLLIPEHNNNQEVTTERPSVLGLLRSPMMLIFFTAVFMMQFSHGTYYTFYSIFLEDLNYSKELVGKLWALGVLAEVILYVFFMKAIVQRYSPKLLMLLSLMLATMRWLLIGFFGDALVILVIAQLLHAATFGVFHAAAIHFVHHNFPHQLHGRGQALYSSISYGLGGVLGSFSSGYAWEFLGQTTGFSISAAVSLASFFILLFLKEKKVESSV